MNPGESDLPWFVRFRQYSQEVTRVSALGGVPRERSLAAYIASQKAEEWECLPDHYDDGGYKPCSAIAVMRSCDRIGLPDFWRTVAAVADPR